jgi:hypothetical protein
VTEIVFAPLVSSPETLGDLDARLPPLRWRSSDVASPLVMELPLLQFVASGSLNWFGDCVAALPALEFVASNIDVGVVTTYVGDMRATLPALYFVADDVPLIVPQHAELSAALPALSFIGYGTTSLQGALVMALPALSARFAEVGGNALRAELAPVSFVGLEQLTIPQTYASLQVQPVMSALASSTWVISSNLLLTDSVVDEVFFILRSRLDLHDRLTPLATFIATVESSFVARDFMRFVIETAIDDTLTLSDSPMLTAEAILAIASRLMLEDEALGWMAAVNVVTSGLVLLDRVRWDVTNTVTSGLALADLVEGNLALITTLIDEVMLLDSVVGSMTVIGLIDSELVLGDGLDGLMTVLLTVEDAINFAVRFRTPDGDEFAGYAMNVRNAAVSEYTNFPFNSFASLRFGGKAVTLMAGPDGIYKMGGDTDDGAPIKAAVRLGLTDFGTTTLKRVSNGFIGYTSDGALKLVVVTTDGGRKKENWYGLKPRAADSPVDGRFDIAKGLTARYWGWAVENIDGADFSLDDLKVWVSFLARRKSGR